MKAMITILIAAMALADATSDPIPPCTVKDLTVSIDGMDGRFNGMQQFGTELSIRNDGRDCSLPALPLVEFIHARGRPLPVGRAAPAPVGTHPDPAMPPIRIASGHRVSTDLRWISGPVYSTNRQLRVAGVRVRIGNASLRVPLTGVIDTEVGKPGSFDQTPLRRQEGTAAS